MSLYIAPQIPPREARVCVWRLGWVCSADCQSAVSQDAILQDCALAGTPEHRQSPADLQSAIRQINNLRYAKQIGERVPVGRVRGNLHVSKFLRSCVSYCEN